MTRIRKSCTAPPSTVGTTDTLSQRDDNTTHERHTIYVEKKETKISPLEKFSHDYSFLGSIFSSAIYIYR